MIGPEYDRWHRERRELLNLLNDEDYVVLGAPAGGVAVVERPDTDEPGDTDLGDWWALELPHESGCPACGRTFRHLWETVPPGLHCLLVWPDEDDPNLLRLAEAERGTPVPYEAPMGQAVSYYELNPS